MKVRPYIISGLALALPAVVSQSIRSQVLNIEQTVPGSKPAAELVEAFDGLGAGLDGAGVVVLEVAGLDRLVLLPGEAGHALADRDRGRDFLDLGRDVVGRLDREHAVLDDVDGPCNSCVTL